MKQRNRKTFYNWLTNRYQLIIRNEENFAEKTTFSFNYARVIVVGFIFFVLVFVGSLYFGKYILSSWYNPDYRNNQQQQEIAELAAYTDSLIYELERKDEYNRLFDAMLMGGEDIEKYLDTTSKFEEIDLSLFNLDSVPYLDEQIRKQYDNSQLTDNEGVDYSDLHFFSPLHGATISESADIKNGKNAVKLVANAQVPVTSIGDGTVFLTGRSHELGNFIIIQHPDNILSIYSQNEEILKNVGNFVKAGDIIAGAGKQSNGNSAVSFEMWINGNPVNPELYIKH